MQYYIIGAFAIYLLIMLGIGFLFSNKSTTLGDYYLGNRKMNKWVVALSAQASDMSGWLLMGLPGAIYVSGLSESWIGIGLVIGTYLNWKIVAKRLRSYSHACNDSVTIPEFFSNRFKDKTGVLGGVSALIILIFFLFYTVSGFVACTKLFTSTFGISPMTALIIGVIVIVAYTLMGGFMAVCWTDLIQGALMFFAIVIVPSLIVYQAGGWADSINSLNTSNAYYLNMFTEAKSGNAVSVISICSSLAWGLGYFGMPHILVRFMAINSPRAITESRRIAMTWVIISLGAACAIGVLGHIFAAQHGVNVDDAEKIFMLMIKQLFHPIFIGIMMSAILAAIMSTADSQLLVSASAFSNDIYKKFIRKNASNKELVIVSRISVAIIAIIAAIIAASDQESNFLKQVMALVSFAWAGFGSSFGPLVLLALFWKKTNIFGAASGMVVGAATAIIWKFVLAANFPEVAIFKLYEIVPGFVLSLITIIVVSLVTKAPSKEITDEFEKVVANDL